MINFDALKKAKRVSVTYNIEEINNEFVKQFRKENALTQVALANLMGVTKKTVEKWEQGKNKISGSSAVLFSLLSENPDLVKKIRKVEIFYGINSDDFETISEDRFCLSSKMKKSQIYDDFLDTRLVASKTKKEKIRKPELSG